MPWPKQEENETLCFWVELTFEWYERAMVFRFYGFPYFNFFVWNNGKIEPLDKSDSRHSYGKYFEVQFWKLLDISDFQSSLTMGFERHLTVADFMDVDQHKRSFFLG